MPTRGPWFLTLLIALFDISKCVFGEGCNMTVSLSRLAEKEGFHRELHSLVTIENTHFFSDCVVAQRELMPSGAYVNPDELADLQRFGLVSAHVAHDINIEGSKENSAPHEVFVFYTLKQSGENLSGSFILPFHLRYHRPLPEGGEANISIEAPLLLLKCNSDTGCFEEKQKVVAPCAPWSHLMCEWYSISYTMETPTIKLKVPVGNLDHYTGVSICTMLTTYSGSLYLIYVLYKNHWR